MKGTMNSVSSCCWIFQIGKAISYEPHWAQQHSSFCYAYPFYPGYPWQLHLIPKFALGTLASSIPFLGQSSSMTVPWPPQVLCRPAEVDQSLGLSHIWIKVGFNWWNTENCSLETKTLSIFIPIHRSGIYVVIDHCHPLRGGPWCGCSTSHLCTFWARFTPKSGVIKVWWLRFYLMMLIKQSISSLISHIDNKDYTYLLSWNTYLK
jgi:hypothetical protein